MEAVFTRVRGVSAVTSGYAGGHVANPSYEDVCRGVTGHAEVVQVAFDPDVVSFRQLLEIFFTIHDPTTKDRQGNDVGSQYRSAVLYHSEEQRATTEAVMKEVAELWSAPLVTEVAPVSNWFAAEAYHQDYYAQNKFQPYCVGVVRPKVAKFRKSWASLLKPDA